MSTEDLMANIQDQHVTFLGGEPLQQRGLIQLIKALKKNNKGIILFTGYSLSELNGAKRKAAALCDVVISERFIEEKKDEKLYLRGSSNQVITFNSKKYSREQFRQPNAYELKIINNEVELHGREKELISRLLECKPYL